MPLVRPDATQHPTSCCPSTQTATTPLNNINPLNSQLYLVNASPLATLSLSLSLSLSCRRSYLECARRHLSIYAIEQRVVDIFEYSIDREHCSVHSLIRLQPHAPARTHTFPTFIPQTRRLLLFVLVDHITLAQWHSRSHKHKHSRPLRYDKQLS